MRTIQAVLPTWRKRGSGIIVNVSSVNGRVSRAAKHGDAHGQFVIGALNSVQPGHEHNLAKAIKLLRRSARGGFTRAMYLLGFLMINHPEIPQNGPNESVIMLTRAAEAGE